MNEDRDIEEIIKLIESSMADGAGHINVTVDENTVKTEVTTSQSICGKNMACQVPTLHEGYDE